MLLTNNKFYVALLAITMLFAPMASGQELDEIEDLDIPAEEEQVDIDDIIDRAQNRHTITNKLISIHEMRGCSERGLFRQDGPSWRFTPLCCQTEKC